MPLELCMQTHRLHAYFERHQVKLRASSWGVAKPLIHVYDRPMSIMIVIDETPADDAARIGIRLHDDNNNFCGARATCALPGGS